MVYTPLVPFNNASQLALSFPFPELGGTIRPAGQGCISCVHTTYCPALYWFQREIQNEVTPNMGIQCLQFTDNPLDQIKTFNAFDVQENEFRNDQGFLREAKPGGYSDPNTTGIWRHDPIDID